MPWDVGFNFRGSSTYVSDGAGETYVTGAETYPTTRTVNGVSVTFGWEDSHTFNLDRASSGDRRLAGASGDFAAGKRFRVDLPAVGDYAIHLAIGDALAAQTVHWQTADGTLALDSYDGDTGAADSFFDAAGSILTAAAWVAGEAAVTRTFASTIFRLQTSAASSSSLAAHVRLVQATSPPPPPPGITDYVAGFVDSGLTDYVASF